MARDWANTKLNFSVFKDRADFTKQGEDAYAKILSTYDSSYASYNDMYKIDASKPSGYNTYSLANLKTITEYQSPTELENYLNNFDNVMASIDMGGAFKKSKLKITDDKRGIFDFGLASKGLQRGREYYSLDLANESPNEFPNNAISGIVPEGLIRAVSIGQTKQFWYDSPTTKRNYLLELRQQGTTAILKKKPNTILKTTNGIVHPQKHEQGLKYVTTNKKSYVMFEKKGGKAKMVELYIPLHDSIMLSHVMPLLLVARFLKLYGVMTRVNTIRLYREGTSGRGELFVGAAYSIKDYGEEFDFNAMAFNGVDGRWWYGVNQVVKAVNDLDSFENNGAKSRKSMANPNRREYYSGSGGQAGTGSSAREDYIAVFSRFRNWYTESIKKGELPPLRVDKKLILIGGAFSSSSDEGIQEEFFRILDTVDFQFNTAEETCKRIYKRLVDDKYMEWWRKQQPIADDKRAKFILDCKSKKSSLVREYKTYVTRLLADTYTYPVGGEYAEPDESAKELADEYDEKIEKMNLFLKTL